MEKGLEYRHNKVDDKGMLLKDIVNSGSFEAKASFANKDVDPIGHLRTNILRIKPELKQKLNSVEDHNQGSNL